MENSDITAIVSAAAHLKCSRCKILHSGPPLEHQEGRVQITHRDWISTYYARGNLYLHPSVVVVFHCGNLGLLKHDLWNPHWDKEETGLWNGSAAVKHIWQGAVFLPAYVLMSRSGSVTACQNDTESHSLSLASMPNVCIQRKIAFFCSIRALEISPNQMTADSLVSGLDHSDKFILTDVIYDVVSNVIIIMI